MEEHRHTKTPSTKEIAHPEASTAHAASFEDQYERQVAQPMYSDVTTLLSWKAPSRPFQKRSKEYFMNILMIAALIEVILFLFGQYLLMVVILALIFLSYTLSTVPPHSARYKITSEGILFDEHFFIWEELYDFHMKRQQGQDLLIITTKAWIPGEIIITLGDLHAEQVKRVLLAFLPYREYVKPTFLEKSGDWLEKNFPLDKLPSKNS